MPNLKTVEIRGKPVKLASTGTNADLARALFNLPANYSVTEVSKALGMNYSQAHSIHKKLNTQSEGRFVAVSGTGRDSKVDFVPTTVPKKLPSGQYHKGAGRGQRLTEDEAATWSPSPARRPAKVIKGKVRDGRMRTGAGPKDVAAGECANCGYDLVVRPLPTGYSFVHTNATAEEYLATIQFCQAVPKSLLEI
jgi:hypothetical protein